MKSPIYFWSRTIFTIFLLVFFYFQRVFYDIYFSVPYWFGFPKFPEFWFYVFLGVIFIWAFWYLYKNYRIAQDDANVIQAKFYNLPIIFKIFKIFCTLILSAFILFVLIVRWIPWLLLLIVFFPVLQNDLIFSFYTLGIIAILIWIIIFIFQIKKYFKKPKDIPMELKNP